MKMTNTLRKTTAMMLLITMFILMTSCSGGYYGAMMPNDALSGENYTEIIENAFVSTSENNTSYFSIDANTASYPNLRSMINNGYSSIPADAVRLEEMLN